MEFKSKITPNTAPPGHPITKKQKSIPGWYGWFCCKHDDGQYYAVVAGDAPMSSSTRYYVITKAMYDECDQPGCQDPGSLFRNGILVYRHTTSVMSPSSEEVLHPEYMAKFRWYTEHLYRNPR